MKRPELNPISVTEAFPIRKGQAYITMGKGQWDSLLADAYRDGWILVEVDEKDKPVAAYRRLGFPI